MDKNTLKSVGEWAQSRVDSGEEPPWTFYKLKQLAEISLELAGGMDASIGVDIPAKDTQSAPQLTGPNVVSIEAFRPVKTEPDFLLPA